MDAVSWVFETFSHYTMGTYLCGHSEGAKRPWESLSHVGDCYTSLMTGSQ